MLVDSDVDPFFNRARDFALTWTHIPAVARVSGHGLIIKSLSVKFSCSIIEIPHLLFCIKI